MVERLAPSGLQRSELAARLADEMGLHFPPDRWRDLERGLQSAAAEFGFADVDSCARWLLSSRLNRRQIEILARALTIGETYFFREPKSFAILERHILPEILRARRGREQRLRIWSAACCTGEEAYSLAIAVNRTIPDPENWHVTILGTDINPHFLARAEAGTYGEWAFRDNPADVKARYFRPIGRRRFEIDPRFRKRVAFEYLNLAADGYPSLDTNTNGMDVIFCRNVLMYFSPEQQRAVIGRLHRSLVEGGWLVVSPTEGSHVLFAGFQSVNFAEGSILYRKDDRKSAAADASAPPDAAFRPLPVLRPDGWNSMGVEALQERPDAPLATPAPPAIPAPPPWMGPAGRPESLPQAGPSACDQARAFYAKGEHDAVIRLLLDSPAAVCEGAPAMALLSRAYANQGRLDEARVWAEKAVAAEKLDPGLCYLWATILEERGEVSAAVAPLRRALYLDPAFVLAHFALGNAALRLHRRQEARRHFRNALALLRLRPADEVLAESEGITAGALIMMIETALELEEAA